MRREVDLVTPRNWVTICFTVLEFNDADLRDHNQIALISAR